MSNSKSKMPDFKEITAMASKLFKDIKKSIMEIADGYKKKSEHSHAKTTQAKPKPKKTESAGTSSKTTTAKKTTKAKSTEKKS